MESISSAIASFLDVGKYISSVVKALEDIAHFKVRSFERKQDRESLILAQNILKNLDSMLFERMFIVHELDQFLRFYERQQRDLPEGREPTGVWLSIYMGRIRQIATHVATSTSNVAELCVLTQYVLPNSALGMEMKKLMMATRTVNDYFIDNLDLFATPTPEFIAIVRDVYSAHKALSSDFYTIMRTLDESTIRNAFLKLESVKTNAANDGSKTTLHQQGDA